jgi:endo-1,4-beta-xylanase
VANLDAAGRVGHLPAAAAAGSAAVHAHRSANRHGQDKFLGAAWSPGTASLNFANYWNQVTPENGGKWGTVEGTRNSMNWSQADEAYALAKSHGFVFKWHTLVWGNQQPNWIAALPPEEQLAEIKEWYAAIAERYPQIDQIDVVNEPLHAPPSYKAALGGDGATGWDWIITAFTMARQYFPNAKLLINDYSITNDGNATTRYLQIIQLLQDRGLIDGIGDQVHAFSTTEAAPMPNHRANLDRLAATGLPIYGTELDLDGTPVGVINDECRSRNFQRVFPCSGSTRRSRASRSGATCAASTGATRRATGCCIRTAASAGAAVADPLRADKIPVISRAAYWCTRTSSAGPRSARSP